MLLGKITANFNWQNFTPAAMNTYLIICQTYAPFPVEETFRETASSIHTAASRALKKFKKQFGRKRLESISLKIRKI